MAEPSVDPNYEYEAPQFYDFNGQSEEEQHIDSWFGKLLFNGILLEHYTKTFALLLF